jgi:hypothetical protein
MTKGSILGGRSNTTYKIHEEIKGVKGDSNLN